MTYCCMDKSGVAWSSERKSRWPVEAQADRGWTKPVTHFASVCLHRVPVLHSEPKCHIETYMPFIALREVWSEELIESSSRSHTA